MATPAFDASVSEKPTAAAPPLSRWRVFMTALRGLELCLAVLLIVWISARLPLAVRISFHYLRSALCFAARPLVVFALSNAIIAAVAAKSGRFSALSSGGDDGAAGEFYDEIVKLNENRPRSGLALGEAEEEEEEEAVVFQDKEVISNEVSAAARGSHDPSSGSDSESEHPRACFTRTRSENFLKRDLPEEEEEEEHRRVLRRSETEKCRKISTEEDEELSNEEFQRTIEAFIAKELRFRREESMAIVLQSH